MNAIQKSEAIKAGLRKGFQDGTSKMAQRRCYGYAIGPSGQLTINPDEAAVVRWIFERYLRGDSLGKIASALETKCILSPTGKSKWNREALNKLLSNGPVKIGLSRKSLYSKGGAGLVLFYFPY